jgi:hypothetical protein
MKNIIATICLISICQTVIAGTHWGGGQFVKLFRSFDKALVNGRAYDDQVEGAVVLGYVSGVHDLGDKILFCSPSPTNNEQLIAIARKYIEARPERWAESASTLISEALTQAFPCR